MSSGDRAGAFRDGRDGLDEPESPEEKPAIGAILRRSNEDAITRTALRAIEHGHAVFLTYRGDADPSILDTLRRIDVRIVTPPSDDDIELLSELLDTAQKAGFPGLVFHDDPSEYIDYEQTTVRASESRSPLVRPVTTASPPSTPQADVIVAIPVYNEADRVGDVVAGARQYADTVLVVDDGSVDGTPQVASEAGATVLRHETNKGYGGALKTIFREARRRDARRLVVLDGDGQHDPDDIPRLLEVQRSRRVDVVIGNRFADGVETDVPRYRRFGLGVVNGLTNVSLGIVRPGRWISDTQSGFRVYGERAIRTLARDRSISDGMAASTDILYHVQHHDYSIAEVGTEIDYDVEGASTHRPLSHGLTLVNNILKKAESKRPVTLIGVPGFALVLVGFAIAHGVFSTFLSTGVVSTLAALAASLCVLVGTVACFAAVMLHSINVHLNQTTVTDSTDG